MCVRFSFVASAEKMNRSFNLGIKEELGASYNIGAGQNAYVLTNRTLDLQVFKWGLIPYWANDRAVGKNLINARAEGIQTQLSFRLPVRQRPCLVFADSYYAWEKEGLQKQPYRVVLKNGHLMAFAGVWDAWLSADNEVIKTFSIITTKANDLLLEKGIKRMPVILSSGVEQNRWLVEKNLSTRLNLLKGLDAAALECYAVDKKLADLAENDVSLHKAL